MARSRIRIPNFLRGLNRLMLFRRGRVHVKYAFTFEELERRAEQGLLFRLAKKGSRLRPIPMGPKEIADWQFLISAWSESKVTRRGTRYFPPTPPFTVYEFREGKLRPLRSNPYYTEIRERATAMVRRNENVGRTTAEMNRRRVMVLEEMILQKERQIRDLEKRKPSPAKKTVQRWALLSHNQKLYNLHSSIVAVHRLQLFRLEQMKTYLSRNTQGEVARREAVRAVDAAMEGVTRKKESAEREERAVRQRINLLTHFPKVARVDKGKIDRYIREMEKKAEARNLAEAKWIEAGSPERKKPHMLELQRAQTQLQYWTAFHTLTTEYWKAYQKYGTTLSKLQVDDIQRGLRQGQEKMAELRREVVRILDAQGAQS